MVEVDSNMLRHLLAEHSVEPGDLGRFHEGEMGEFLDEVRPLITDADPVIRRQTCDALDQIVAEEDRDHFYGLLIEHLDTAGQHTLLTDPDPQVRTRVCWVTSWKYRASGLQRVALRVLADDGFDYAWPECIEVLRRPIKFSMLVGALAKASSAGMRERLLVTFGLSATTSLPEVSAQQPAAPISCMQWYCKAAAARQCPHVPVLLALLGSSNESIRHKAMRELKDFGPGVVDALQSVRWNPVVRRAALIILAEFGWRHITADDLLIIRRLIRTKQHVEVPEPLLMYEVDGAWLAFPTTNQDMVLDALGLTDPLPATLRMGFALWRGKGPEKPSIREWTIRSGDSGTRAPQRQESSICPDVFVTPALDGWTLAFYRNETLDGMTPGSTSWQSRYELYERMQRSSRLFGSAHCYQQLTVDDYGELTWSQWCVAREGEVRMHCVSSDDVYVYRCEDHDPVDTLTELSAWLETNDRGRGLRSAQEEADRSEAWAAVLQQRNGDDRLPPEDHEPGSTAPDEDCFPAADPAQDLVFGAYAAARRLSIDLQCLGPETRVEGAGVLAVPHSLRHFLRRGVLPI